ncbi:MAG: hypothetical protein KDD69_07705 [Bdellovibrionales bacterium]|nr:hypothetical protein [Bdellovibrionales bacterium]
MHGLNKRKGVVLAATAALCGLGACSDGRLKEPEDWNKTERGAVVGGAGGAGLGALVGSQSGNTGAGAVVGGAAGAAAGGLLGHELDKDDD